MTEGAERGTPSDTPRCDSDRSWKNHSWVKTETAEAIERDLTEALKVAGELVVDYARHQSLCNGALGGRCTCGLDDKRAALERIRNNKH